MNIVFKILQKIGRYSLRKWHLHRFLWLEKGAHRQLVVGKQVRFNVLVRGGGAGTLIIGDRNSFGFCLAPRLGTGEILLQARHPDAKITIGEENVFNNNLSIVANGQINIGNGCQIGDQVAIYDCDFHEIDPAIRNRGPGPVLPVHIGNNVWLGSRVMVLKGVSIGDNTVVGAMSIVTHSLPSNVVAVGIPAKIIRSLE